ncbi:nitrogenase component 1 [Anaeroselena agilis]|uniref:Nitrogenase component 1 n=1 Tax=Anaeroselena agilis TaxID=3063788 RepID=A0ABU3NZB2_9FIRM|nr:nitrogenase component 1 [Selenomonadales bacterium 4137-cl]
MADLKVAKSVSENPCHMCMPIGGILPLKGVEGAMVLIHGSQGCSTYMRRTMAEHFNEPVDVGSSALNEKGTVYGGGENLKQALDNIRKVYDPRLIGILTTCLAETIGEDIERLAAEYLAERGLADLVIVPVSTPGYGGSQADGYYLALRRIVAALAQPTPRHDKINIIAANVSPADIRELKRLLAAMDIEYTLLPDFADTLDRPYSDHYTKMAPGGTPLDAIRAMPGAAATIEMGVTVPPALSPGQLLADEYGVALHRLPIPIGVAATDLFLRTLREITGRKVPAGVLAERGRLLDAMIDSHKHNFAGRSVIFGEPEMVYAVTRTCLENGVWPTVVAAGGAGGEAVSLFKDVLAASPEPSYFLSETDFAEIRFRSAAAGANIAIGPSDGRYLTEKEGIPLVRLGFPILDRMGGQRILSVGYTGTANLLDRITNTLLDAKHHTYRTRIYDEFYKGRRLNLAPAQAR